MTSIRYGIAFVAALALAGCGTNPGERAITGAAIGAAGGAIVGAMVGAPGTGAAIGAGLGGATGALTTKKDIDIGDPFWKKSSRGEVSGVREIQSGLTQLGYDPGPADGYFGSKTRTAIRQYQQDQGLLVNGKASPELLSHIKSRTG